MGRLGRGTDMWQLPPRLLPPRSLLSILALLEEGRVDMGREGKTKRKDRRRGRGRVCASAASVGRLDRRGGEQGYLSENNNCPIADVGHTGHNPSDTQEINKTRLFYCVRDAVSLHKSQSHVFFTGPPTD